MRIYLFDHHGVQLFIMASTEEQARAIIATHYSSAAAGDATYIDSGLSFTAHARGNGEPYVHVDPL